MDTLDGLRSRPVSVPVVPPAPPPLDKVPSSWRQLRYYSTNVLEVWPRGAYEDDTVVFPIFGRTLLLINRPEDIRRVLIDNGTNYGRTRPTIRLLRPLLGDGMFFAMGDAWKHQRRTTAPAFAPKAVPAFARATAMALEEALPSLATRAATDAAIDLLGWCQTLALDVAGRALFSLPMRELSAAVRRGMLTFSRRHNRLGFFDFFLPLSCPSPGDIGRAWFRRGWFRLMDRLIADRRALGSPPGSEDVFDLLQSARDPETGAPFDDRELRDQFATLIITGHETTAITLFWAIYLLTLDPTWQARLAAEVEGLDLGPDHIADNLPDLPVARAIIQEAMRLYPPAFIIARMALGHDRLTDVDVKPETVLMISPWVLHRHRRQWAQPDAFDPQRFLPGAPIPDRFAYLPFGTGPRVCIGAPLAMTEATVVLATLAQRFRWETNDDRPVLPVGIVTTQPDHLPSFRLHPRPSLV